jgi:hypothetical protein
VLEAATRLARDGLFHIVPEPPLQRLRAYRRSNVFRRTGVVFIHVPKAAGTSIAETVFGRFVGHFGVVDVLAACPPDVQALPRFSVVRNPWDRVVSAWTFARAGSGLGGSTTVRIHAARQYRVPAFERFDTFVSEWLAVRDVERLDGVFRPQSAYVTDATGELRLDHLGRLEQLAETEAWLSSVLGRKIEFGRANTSSHEHYRSYYTSETRRKVGEIYARDIALFGYEF